MTQASAALLSSVVTSPFSENFKGDEAMRMRLKSGRWYSNFFHHGRKIEVSLEAYEHETRKAQMNLGKVLRDIENGISPGSMRKKIKHLRVKKKLNERNEQILRKHILPFFGDFKPREITETLMASYLEHRWGRTKEGELQAVVVTMKKELSVLRLLISSVDPAFKVPKVDYISIKKDILPPLRLEEIKRAGGFVPKKYQAIFWVMVYTAMDISDVVCLKPKDFNEGWIIKKRGKTKQDIRVPVCRALADVLEEVPRPINSDGFLFPSIVSS